MQEMRRNNRFWRGAFRDRNDALFCNSLLVSRFLRSVFQQDESGYALGRFLAVSHRLASVCRLGHSAVLVYKRLFLAVVHDLQTMSQMWETALGLGRVFRFWVVKEQKYERLAAA